MILIIIKTFLFNELKLWIMSTTLKTWKSTVISWGAQKRSFVHEAEFDENLQNKFEICILNSKIVKKNSQTFFILLGFPVPTTHHPALLVYKTTILHTSCWTSLKFNKLTAILCLISLLKMNKCIGTVPKHRVIQ